MRAAVAVSLFAGLVLTLVPAAASKPATPGGLLFAAAAPQFSERFESGLSRWIGKGGGRHSGAIVADPLRPGNHVLTFKALGDGGDIFGPTIAVSKARTYRLTFEYLGRPGRGVAGDLGGFLGIALGTPGVHYWLAGTSSGDKALIDDGRWHTYTIDFTPGAKLAGSFSAIRVMLEDYVASKGVAGDAYFDNIAVSSRECHAHACDEGEPVRVFVTFHANNLPTTPPVDGGACPGASSRARVTGKVIARITEINLNHEGGGDVHDTPHLSRCRVPRILFRVDRVQLEVLEPGKIMRVRLAVHIDGEAVHRPDDCRVGTRGTIVATYDDTTKAANSLRNHSLRIGPWAARCTAHNHLITNNITSITAGASSSTWVRVWIACKGENTGFAPRHCGT